MCKLFITDIGKLVTPALIRIPASNFVAPVLKDNEIVQTIKPLEGSVLFLVDTGADATCISSLDAAKLGIQTAYLEPTVDVIGIGGNCKTFKLSNIEIVLIDDFDETKVKFHIEALDFVYVIETADRRMLSLLGMDILNRFDLSTHREKKTAALTRLPNAPGRFRAASRSLTY